MFQEFGTNPDNAFDMFLIKIRRRKLELTSDGNKLREVKVIWKINFVYSILFQMLMSVIILLINYLSSTCYLLI